MKTLGKWLGRVLLLILALVLFLWLGPRERIEGIARAPALPDPVELNAWLAINEGQVDDLRPGTEKLITWAGEMGAVTPLSVVYIHGFSATRGEAAPAPAKLAEALGANLFETRLTGHGRTGDAMAEPRAEAWLDDTAEAMAIGRAIGEEVVVIGVSTGGTLAVWAATDAQMAEALKGIIFVSPNFTLANPAGGLLELPFARAWVPLIAGAERAFEPMNEGHGAFWTTRYPTVATVTMGTLLRETRALDISAVDAPALFLFSDEDQVISAEAVRGVAGRWGAPTTVETVSPGPGIDPFNHVILGDILSPAHTDQMVERLAEWVRNLP